MSDGTDMVCPNCGNETFYAVRLVYQTVYYNGDGEIIDRGEETEHPDYAITYKCQSCREPYESIPDNLVTEAHFHEVIAVKDQE